MTLIEARYRVWPICVHLQKRHISGAGPARFGTRRVDGIADFQAVERVFINWVLVARPLL
jgi:hypothetical protein